MKDPRNYSLTDIKKLFAKSGNRCAHPNCSNPICDNEGTVLGEICHIHPLGKKEPRYDSQFSKADLRSYENLILLCSNCHKKVDNPKLKHEYTSEWLINLKEKHELSMNQQMPTAFLQEEFFNAIIEKLLSSLSKLEPNPRLKTYHLQKMDGSEKWIPLNTIRKSNQYTIAFFTLIIIAIILPIGQFFFSDSYLNFDRSLRGSFILALTSLFVIAIAFKKGYRYTTILTPFKPQDKDTYRWGKFAVRQNNGYMLYERGFMCGFPGCQGKVKVIRVSSLFDLEERYKGTCEHNQMGHTYIATRERAWYYDFTPDKILEEMRRIKK